MSKIKQACLIALLMFAGHAADAQQWNDVTDVFITNPDFEDGDNGWEKFGSCGSYGAINYGCMEFWNGWFNLSQQLTGLPQGKYRLSVQAYYRCGDFNNIYRDYTDGNEQVTAMLYASEEEENWQEQPLVSVFTETFHPDWTWGSDWAKKGTSRRTVLSWSSGIMRNWARGIRRPACWAGRSAGAAASTG